MSKATLSKSSEFCGDFNPSYCDSFEAQVCDFVYPGSYVYYDGEFPRDSIPGMLFVPCPQCGRKIPVLLRV